MLIFTSMSQLRKRALGLSLILFAPLLLAACGGGGGTTTPPPPPPPPPPAQVSKAFKTADSTSRFLGKATFGATQGQIDGLTDTEVSTWILNEFNKQPTLYLQSLIDEAAALPQGEDLDSRRVSDMFLDEAIAGNDQLRQRMVYALSQIIVVSNSGQLDNFPLGMGYYLDTLSENAFGNYRDLLEQITYSPAMGVYLTYLANEKGDPDTGRMPDENYARELLQLFTIGLNELNLDGTVKTDGQGQPIPTYDNNDITGLAKVFTGLSTANSNFFNIFRGCPSFDECPQFYQPMEMFDEYHSDLEKSFLNTTISAGTPGVQTIDDALDTIFNHPNVAPFVARQLIQRLVTSNPKPAYVQRVANAFESGRYTLPDGRSTGTGARGDLKATLAAILLDDEALQAPSAAASDFGKIREPILRWTNWARAFQETTPDTEQEIWLYPFVGRQLLGQHPFYSPSVFNFYRPGYVAPGTATGAAGLTAPELQIINENTSISYVNFINGFIYDFSPTENDNPDDGVNANYTREIGLADDANALIDHLDLLLTGNSLSQSTKDRIVQMMGEIPIQAGSEDEDKYSRVVVAISMVMTSPEYLVQK